MLTTTIEVSILLFQPAAGILSTWMQRHYQLRILTDEEHAMMLTDLTRQQHDTSISVCLDKRWQRSDTFLRQTEEQPYRSWHKTNAIRIKVFHNASVAAWVKVNLPPYEGWKWFTDPSGYNMSAVDCSCHGWIHTTNRKVCFHEVGGLAEKTKHEWLISKMTEQKTLKGNTLKPIPAGKCMKWDQWFKKWIISQSLKKMGFYSEYVPEGLMTVHLHCAL